MRIKKYLLTTLMAVSCVLSACDSDGKDEKTSTDVSTEDKADNKEDKDDKEDNKIEGENDLFKDNKYIVKLPSEFNDGDEPIICVNNMNLEIHGDMIQGFKFHVLTKEKLEEGDVEVKIDSLYAKYELVSSEPVLYDEIFSKDVCVNYGKEEWGKLSSEEIYDKELVVPGEYSELNKDMFPKFYDNCFIVNISYDVNFSEELEKNHELQHTIEDMVVVVKGKEYKVDIGTIELYNKWPRYDVGTHQLSFESAGKSYVGLVYNNDGFINTMSDILIAKDDVKIKNVWLVNNSEDLSLEEVAFTSLADGNEETQVWEKGKDIVVGKGEEIVLNLSVKDKKFAEQYNYNVNLYIAVEYECNGKLYVTQTQQLFETRYNADEMYAMYKDGIDIIN